MLGTVTIHKEAYCPLIISRGEFNGNPAQGFKYKDYSNKEHIFYLGIETSNNKLYIAHSINGVIGDKVYITDTIPGPSV